MTMHSPQPHLQRHLDATRSSFRTLEIHDLGCEGCEVCEPYVPSVPSRLTAAHMGQLAVAAAIVGSAIMFAIDPAGAAAALYATVGL